MNFEIIIQKFIIEITRHIYPFFELATFLGDEIVVLLLICFVYYAVDKKKGEEIAMIALSSAAINSIIKSIFARPRPFVREPDIASAKYKELYAGSYSFPSGHSQNAGAVYAYQFNNTNKKYFKAIYLAALVLVPLSRMVLGVHYLSDVLAGLILGMLIAVAFPQIVKNNAKVYLALSLIIIAASPALFFVSIDQDIIKAAGALSGAGLAIFIENKYIKFAPPKKQIYAFFRFAIALSVAAAARFGLKYIFDLAGGYAVLDFIRYFITTFAVVAVSFLFRYIKI